MRAAQGVGLKLCLAQLLYQDASTVCDIRPKSSNLKLFQLVNRSDNGRSSNVKACCRVSYGVRAVYRAAHHQDAELTAREVRVASPHHTENSFQQLERKLVGIGNRRAGKHSLSQYGTVRLCNTLRV